MPYQVQEQVALEVTGKMQSGRKGNEAIAAALNKLETDGWLLVQVVAHSQNQGLTKYILHKQ